MFNLVISQNNSVNMVKGKNRRSCCKPALHTTWLNGAATSRPGALHRPPLPRLRPHVRHSCPAEGMITKHRLGLDITGISLTFSHLVFDVFNPLKCIPEKK